jgi:hypothetical protein
MAGVCDRRMASQHSTADRPYISRIASTNGPSLALGDDGEMLGDAEMLGIEFYGDRRRVADRTSDWRVGHRRIFANVLKGRFRTVGRANRLIC